jgi:endonuclease/exonuclease/phosphatase family metal-dependent hydrolase
LRAHFDTDAVKLPFRPDPPQWPKLLVTAAASSLATLFVTRNFFPAEKKVRHPIRANYNVGDEVFVRTMGHLLGPSLVEGNKVTPLGRENRATIEIDIETNLGAVHIINTHLGLGWRERLFQAQLFTSAEWHAAIAGDAPLILLGDFNSRPGSRPYRALTRSLRDMRELVRATRPIRTFPTWFPALAVNHIS